MESVIKFVLIGNVDHGKSTLGGSILVSTGNVTENDVRKIRNEANDMKMSSFWLAYILDIDESERIKGKTHSYNVVSFTYKSNKFELIDVPGHKDLVQEMIYGTSQANVAILVLSARKGEYEAGLSGQTIEHTLIVKGMGITTLIVCINKMDTIEWNRDTYNFIVNDFSKKIKKYRFKEVIFVPISAYNQENIIVKYDNYLAHKSLMDTLIEMHESLNHMNHLNHLNHLNHKEIKLNDNYARGKFIFYHIDNLITTGYKCKLHTKDKLYDCTIFKIFSLQYITQLNSQNKLIDITIKISDVNNESHAIDTLSSQHIILRNGNNTIAIGIFEY